MSLNALKATESFTQEAIRMDSLHACQVITLTAATSEAIKPGMVCYFDVATNTVKAAVTGTNLTFLLIATETQVDSGAYKATDLVFIKHGGANKDKVYYKAATSAVRPTILETAHLANNTLYLG